MKHDTKGATLDLAPSGVELIAEVGSLMGITDAGEVLGTCLMTMRDLMVALKDGPVTIQPKGPSQPEPQGEPVSVDSLRHF